MMVIIFLKEFCENDAHTCHLNLPIGLDQRRFMITIIDTNAIYEGILYQSKNNKKNKTKTVCHFILSQLQIR